MLESFTTDLFEYDRLTPEEQQKRGILGRLVGVIADTLNPTRNGRKYSSELWDKVFEDPIMKERIANKCCFGELGHPTDREETDMEKIAICMDGVPKKDKNGKLQAVFNILDTPNGRILKTLCDYGCNIGVSSRGSGDTFTDIDGTESVDPNTYNCECWDAVLIPAVKEARLNYVTESLNNKVSFKQALAESLNSANDNERKIMEETLSNLNIDLEEEVESKEEDIEDNSLNINEGAENTAVDNNEAMVEELQNTLKQKQQLESQVIELQEKLSVCYAKEASLTEDVEKYKKAVSKLSDGVVRAKALEEKVSKLQESNETLNKQLNASNEKIHKLEETAKLSNERRQNLRESVSSKDVEIERLNESIKTLEAKSKAESESLNESIAELQKDISLKKAEYSKKIDAANKLIEKYKKVATGAVDKYIESQAVKLGVSSNEIKNRLPESYSFDDIDLVCEDMQNYKLTVSKLPFRTNNLKENVQVKVTPSKNESILPASRFDDEADDTLLSLAGLK